MFLGCVSPGGERWWQRPFGFLCFHRPLSHRNRLFECPKLSKGNSTHRNCLNLINSVDSTCDEAIPEGNSSSNHPFSGAMFGFRGWKNILYYVLGSLKVCLPKTWVDLEVIHLYFTCWFFSKLDNFHTLTRVDGTFDVKDWNLGGTSMMFSDSCPFKLQYVHLNLHCIILQGLVSLHLYIIACNCELSFYICYIFPSFEKHFYSRDLWQTQVSTSANKNTCYLLVNMLFHLYNLQVKDVFCSLWFMLLKRPV